MNESTLKIVKEFYEKLPFNYHSTPRKASRELKENPIKVYPDVDELLKKKKIKNILEIGCGVGWFTNSAAYHYKVKAKGIDLTALAIKRAKDISEILKTKEYVSFENHNLYEYEAQEKADLVVSIGVLPAVDDPLRAFQHIQKFVRPGKYIFLGFYHHYGRKVFRKYFDNILKNDGEQKAYRVYKSMHKQLKDETQLKSWFRDQILHPHEIWHTLEEVYKWFSMANFNLISTSINKFQPFDNVKDLIEEEKRYEHLACQAIYEQQRYFPGFFTVLGQKK